MIIRDILLLLEEFAPQKLKENWDNCGLLIGDADRELENILVCMDVTEEAICYALDNKCNLIVSHHPIIFNPIKNLSLAENKKIITLVKNDIAVFAMHTNLDSAQKGINDALASALDMKSCEPIRKNYSSAYKLAVFAPESGFDAITLAAFSKGAGIIGNYEGCVFKSEGVGYFSPNDGAEPYSKSGEKELRIELKVSDDKLSSVISAIKQVHPYEEPVIDVYSIGGKDELSTGLGRFGFIDPMKSQDFIELARERINSNLRYNSIEKEISSVAVCGGAGVFLLHDVIDIGADVFVTSEVKHHDYITAKEAGLLLIDAGHYETEVFGIYSVYTRLKKETNNILWFESKS